MLTSRKVVDKLTRPCGLCTSVACTDRENAQRIRAILACHLSGCPMEFAGRTSLVWEPLQGLPMDFGGFRYRAALTEL